jgi:hypothetical protein
LGASSWGAFPGSHDTNNLLSWHWGLGGRIINVIIAQVSLFMRATGIIQINIMAVIGGVLSYAFTWLQQCVDAHCPSHRDKIKDQNVAKQK